MSDTTEHGLVKITNLGDKGWSVTPRQIAGVNSQNFNGASLDILKDGRIGVPAHTQVGFDDPRMEIFYEFARNAIKTVHGFDLPTPKQEFAELENLVKTLYSFRLNNPSDVVTLPLGSPILLGQEFQHPRVHSADKPVYSVLVGQRGLPLQMSHPGAEYDYSVPVVVTRPALSFEYVRYLPSSLQAISPRRIDIGTGFVARRINDHWNSFVIPLKEDQVTELFSAARIPQR